MTLRAGSLLYLLQHPLKADYHMHSTVSDGQFAPAEVVARAAKNGVAVMSLTDHDDLGGWEIAQQTALENGIRLITGVEISTTWHGKTIHILGYGFRPQDTLFDQRLSDMRQGRDERSIKIADKLTALGIPDTLAGAQGIAKRQSPISRTHFGRYLVMMGYCKNFAQAMNQYLADGKPASVEHDWISVKTAVRWILDAGGHAFIAHPLRYKMPGLQWSLDDLIEDFKAAGGVGIEVVYNQLGSSETKAITDIAFRHRLFASRGSDFHTDTEGADIGAIPALPPHLLSIEKLLHLS